MILNPCRNRNTTRSVSHISAPIYVLPNSVRSEQQFVLGHGHSVASLSDALLVILISLHTSFGSN